MPMACRVIRITMVVHVDGYGYGTNMATLAALVTGKCVKLDTLWLQWENAPSIGWVYWQPRRMALARSGYIRRMPLV